MQNKVVILILFLIICSCGLKAQKKNKYLNVDNLMLQIPDSLTKTTDGFAKYINANFANETDKARAVFIWIAKNIRYEYANMFAIDFNQTPEEAIDKVLITHSGICMHYAELFNNIANKVGLKSYIIPGYTKQRGFVDYVAHVWCGINIDSTWCFVDPTWGSGYIENGRFVNVVNNKYFKATPEQLIVSHMPFDPLWQFSHYPLTSQEFYDGERQDGVERQLFSFKDTLATYEKQPEIEQLVYSANRIIKNGVKSTLVFQRLDYQKKKIEYLKIEIENKKNQKAADDYNTASNIFNNGVALLNEFINYRNRQFVPIKTDAEIKQMVDTVAASFNLTREKLSNLVYYDPNFHLTIAVLVKSIENASQNLADQQAFVTKYIKTPKANRKALFYYKK